MKFLILLSCFCLLKSEEINTSQNLFTKENVQDVESDLFLKLLNTTISSVHKKRSKAGIVANLNDYFDEILENLAQDIIFDGYDPAELPDETLSLLILGKITIDKGWLRDLSTISRYRDIELSYSSAEKKLVLNFAIQFEFLQFTYDYVTELPLMTIRGEVEGKVEHVKIESALSFDFHTYHVALDYFNIMDTGKISIKFSGEGLVDWVTNAMTSVITTFLHPLILGIVQNVTKGPLQNSIDAINEAISKLINQ